MERIIISSADGARAELVSHGAHVCSWLPAGGPEQLFLSANSEFTETAAIRGGVPIVFPQFSGMGVLPKHGFARTAEWKLLSAGQTKQGAGQAVFELQENIARLMLWPHVFRAEYMVTLAGDTLQLDFSVTNTGDTVFQFTTALHTYFKIEDLVQTQLHGLGGLTYRDTVTGQNGCIQTEEVLRIAAEIDRIYANVRQPVVIEQEHQTVEVTQAGFQDAVVWNPGFEKAAQITDLETGAFQRMVCVEAATIMRPVALEPGRSWSGMQRMVWRPR
jgi:glucose-6-phosphate 1-epimerase